MWKYCLLSLFGIGYIKPFSATWGSLGAGFILFVSWPYTNWFIKLIIMVLILVIGSYLSTCIEQEDKLHDPYFIVIDELLGMMVTAFFLEAIWWHWILAFFLFRFFDIAKFWPASVFDKQSGGFSVMIDDVLMGVLATVFLHLFLYFL